MYSDILHQMCQVINLNSTICPWQKLAAYFIAYKTFYLNRNIEGCSVQHRHCTVSRGVRRHLGLRCLFQQQKLNIILQHLFLFYLLKQS